MKVLTLCGGAALSPQIISLAHCAHIIVGTPGRVSQHFIKGTLRLVDLEILVLDGGSRARHGFEHSLDAILTHVPNTRQTQLFSASYPDEIEALVQRVTRNPDVAKVHSALAETD